MVILVLGGASVANPPISLLTNSRRRGETNLGSGLRTHAPSSTGRRSHFGSIFSEPPMLRQVASDSCLHNGPSTWHWSGESIRLNALNPNAAALHHPLCLTHNYRRPKAGVPAVRYAFPPQPVPNCALRSLPPGSLIPCLGRSGISQPRWSLRED